jgi:hypothetical protein
MSDSDSERMCNQDDSTFFVGFYGVFLLPSGHVAAVYGCTAQAVSVRI